jgi:hypothetical protein
MQSDFFGKVQAFREDPSRPEPKLVFLGDYIDRGRFSYNGILRTAMQLFVTAPEHVYVLRGNHEWYVDLGGWIRSGVHPAEAIATMRGHAPNELFDAYRELFEAMPTTLLFDRVLFVHAGIPRDQTLRDKWRDLSSLNDPEVRFQMMWSDPSEADYIPDRMQGSNARFPFGRIQFERFMNHIGCTTMVRGHVKINEGFKTMYGVNGGAVLLNVFSAGGRTNDDLPRNSSYRDVSPMALTMTWDGGALSATPWKIDYERYNDPACNGLLRNPPEIEMRSE